MSSAVARTVDRGGCCDPAPCQHVCHRESREAGRRAAGRLCLASLALSTDDDDVDVVSRRRADRAGRGDWRLAPAPATHERHARRRDGRESHRQPSSELRARSFQSNLSLYKHKRDAHSLTQTNHSSSQRASAAVVRVNCSAVSYGLFPVTIPVRSFSMAGQAVRRAVMDVRGILHVVTSGDAHRLHPHQ